MSDPLAPFRRTPVMSPSDPASASPSGVRQSYAAFGVKDRVERLKIHRASDPSRSPAYASLLDIVYDGEFGANFVLMWDFLIVEVRGRNLQELVHALQSGNCEFIQEYDRDRWDAPKDAGAAFIDSIVVHVPERGADVENRAKK